MSNETIENATPASDVGQPKAKRKGSKKTKATKKQAAARKAVRKAKADRSNKNAVIIELLKRAKGAMVAEITKATT